MGWGLARGVGGSVKGGNSDLGFQTPASSEVSEPSHATKCCQHGCPQGKESDEMWGNRVAWRVGGRGFQMDQRSTHTHTLKGGDK